MRFKHRAVSVCEPLSATGRRSVRNPPGPTRITSERVHLSTTLNYSCYTMYTHKENRPRVKEQAEIQKSIKAVKDEMIF